MIMKKLQNVAGLRDSQSEK